MVKRLLNISIILLIMFSLTSCMAPKNAKNQQAGDKSSQTLSQEKKLSPGASDNGKTIQKENADARNPSGNSENINTGSKGSDSTALIDDTLNALKDMGGISDSLDIPSDDDLAVPIPQ